ncbi:alpha/beta fold hydrolase [Corynebacterium sp. A21]|uniref:alpha/beta fold hydrolase n=1 Tax=Corynebacterium sp. A21 TaxID=3457318 RepID=UPI003FD62C9B
MSWLTWIPTRGELPALAPLDGSGATPVLFLHGVLASPGNFEAAVRELNTRGVPVIAPAYGNRGTGDIRASFAELAALLSREILPVTQHLDIVGHSLGGRLGLQLAHHFPGRVRTLVGIGAAYRGVPRGIGRAAAVRHRIIARVGGPAYHQLMVLAPLAAEVPAGTRVVSLISDADIIVPASSASLGEVRQLHGVRHEHLPQQSSAILEALAWRE